MSIFVKLCSLVCRIFGIQGLYEEVNVNTTPDVKKFKVSAVAAVARNRVIGKDGDIPWRGKLPGEQLLFKEVTKGKAVIMGRKTYFSIPPKYRPLPGRLNIVLTSTPSPSEDGHVECSTVLEALLYASAHLEYDEAVFIGGQRVYEEGLLHCDTLYLSELDAIFDGDTYFPEFDKDEWELESEKAFPMKEGQPIGYKFRTYRRV